jgi:hypothetical protein
VHNRTVCLAQQGNKANCTTMILILSLLICIIMQPIPTTERGGYIIKISAQSCHHHHSLLLASQPVIGITACCWYRSLLLVLWPAIGFTACSHRANGECDQVGRDKQDVDKAPQHEAVPRKAGRACWLPHIPRHGLKITQNAISAT